MSFNTRRIVALAVVLLASTFGGLLAVAFFDSQVAPILGVVVGGLIIAMYLPVFELAGNIEAS